jgi:signal peptidase I
MDAETGRRAVWCELVHEVAGAQGEVRLKVAGGSMLPTVWPGDVVTVRQCTFEELRPGQIVLHGRDETLTLHRIARVASDHVITRGDSLPKYDQPVKASDILGQVVSLCRGGRSIPWEQVLWQRVVAAVLRRSRFLRRGTVYLHRHLRGTGARQAAGSSATPLPVGKE